MEEICKGLRPQFTDGQQTGRHRMEALYGRNDLQKYEKDTIQFPSPGRYMDELHLLGTRHDPETAQSNTRTVDILQHTNT